MSLEEDRLVARISADWTLEGRPLTFFKCQGAEWGSFNLAPDDTGGKFKSGPDRVYHDGRDTIVVVEAKVAKSGRNGGASKLEMCQQVFGYGLQAMRALTDPKVRISARSDRRTACTFESLCRDSGFMISPNFRVVLALVTLVPEDPARHREKHLRKYLDEHLAEVDFGEQLRSAPMTAWRKAIVARMPTAVSDFSWAVVEDVNVASARSIDFVPLPSVGRAT